MKCTNSSHKFHFAVIENIVFTSVFVAMLGIWFCLNDGSSIMLIMLILASALFTGVVVTTAYWLWTGKLCTVNIYADRIEWRRHFKKVIAYTENITVERVSYGAGGGMQYFISAQTSMLFNSIRKCRALAYVPYYLAFRVRDKLTGASVLLDFTSVQRSVKLSDCENTVVAEAARKGIVEYKRCAAQARFKSSLGFSRKFEKCERNKIKVRVNWVFALYVYILSAFISIMVVAGMIIALASGPEWEAFTAIALMGIAYAIIIFVLIVTDRIKTVTLDNNGVLYRKHLRKSKIAYGDMCVERVENLKIFPRSDFAVSDINKPKRKAKIRLTPEKIQAVLKKCDGTQFHDVLTAALDEWNECENGSVLCGD